MRDAIPLPPPELNFVGDGDFATIGEHFLTILTEHAGLRPHHRVLDVGCGIGRLAAPLTRYLDARGRYEGFDVVDVGIDWCRREVTPRFPHFRFQLADVYSGSYHPRGRYAACEYEFPYADGAFDVVVLTSVFTHMLPADVANYVAQVARVLKPGGTALATFFLRNAESERLTAAGRSRVTFHPRRGYGTANPRQPEDAICYDEAHVLGLLGLWGLAPAGPVHYGAWCGRGGALNGHDIVVATKVRSVAVPRPRRRRVAALVRAVRRWVRPPRGATAAAVAGARAAAGRAAA